jgi:hypothetical protein
MNFLWLQGAEKGCKSHSTIILDMEMKLWTSSWGFSSNMFLERRATFWLYQERTCGNYDEVAIVVGKFAFAVTRRELLIFRDHGIIEAGQTSLGTLE